LEFFGEFPFFFNEKASLKITLSSNVDNFQLTSTVLLLCSFLQHLLAMNWYSSFFTSRLSPFVCCNAIMDTKDLSHHREMEIEPKNVPSNNETIEMLFEYFD